MKNRICAQLARVMVIVALMSFSVMAQTSSVIDHFAKQYSPSVTLALPNGDVSVYYGGDVYYLEGRARTHIVYVDAPQNARNRIIGLGDQTYRLEFASSNDEVATIDEYGQVHFHTPGDVVFTVRAGETEAAIPVRVIDPPFPVETIKGAGVPIDDFVEVWGFPDQVTKRTIRWPDRSAVVEGLIFSFGGTSTIDLELWEYEEWPTVLFRVSSGRIVSVSQLYWSMTYQLLAPSKLGL